MESTKLEQWCEAWWKEHGYDVKIVRRELTRTEYLVNGELWTVPLVPVVGYEQFRKNFLSYWKEDSRCRRK